MPVVPREATSNRAWASRRTKESHLRPVGFFCCSKGASNAFVNGLLGNAVLRQREDNVRSCYLDRPLQPCHAAYLAAITFANGGGQIRCRFLPPCHGNPVDRCSSVFALHLDLDAHVR